MDKQIVDAPTVRVTCRRIAAFFPLLQRGFRVVARTGCSLNQFLSGQLGIDPDYVEERVKTVFLNGSPVDDFDTTMIRDEITLALSAAMPGLVGAVLRRGGVLASFRHSISSRPQACGPDAGQGAVKIKLFNILVRELGPGFLEQGVWIHASELIEVAGTDLEKLGDACESIRIAGTDLNLEEAARNISELENQWIRLQVLQS